MKKWLKVISLNLLITKDRAERHDFLPWLCLFFSPFLFPPKEREKKKWIMKRKIVIKSHAFLIDLLESANHWVEWEEIEKDTSHFYCCTNYLFVYNIFFEYIYGPWVSICLGLVAVKYGLLIELNFGVKARDKIKMLYNLKMMSL